LRKEYLAYTFLYEDTGDLRCDFEILTDEISSMTGFLRSLIDDPLLREELTAVNELMYHLNPSLRTMITVTGAELDWLYARTMEHKAQSEPNGKTTTLGKQRFVLPQGCKSAAYSHILRNRCKVLVRLLSRYRQQGHVVDDLVFDFANLFSGYFHFLALALNKSNGVTETEFISRVYK
jgi:cob(I)alamin adenosyltransferase